jgi:competence protein ComEC
VSERWAFALAAAALTGAALSTPVPLLALAGTLAAALAARHPVMVCLALLLVTSELGHRADAGLASGPEGPVAGEVLLVTDPRPSGKGLRAEARLGRHRVLLRAAGPAAEALAPRLAGEHLRIAGQASPAEPEAWLRSRHIAARLMVWRVDGWREGPAVARLANGLRRTLEEGAAPLDPHDRSLFTGLVVGDDRFQAPELADDFRASSLTHLLAVSGQNVAFVLALASPVLRRLRLWPRLFAALAVIVMFGVVTRFEPSVLRASAVAALSVLLATVGRPADRLRVLALALTALVVVDPLLVESVGFQLSAAASAGILLLARPIARLLRGPLLLREPLAVTVAAQIGVSPVIVAVFGPMPLAAVPANLLAVPAAGAVMLWGLSAGLVAGLAGGSVAEVVHVPTRLLVGWVALVARRSAGLPLGELDGIGTALVGAGVVVAATLRHRRLLARCGALTAAVVVAVTVAGAWAPAPLRVSPMPGVVVWRQGGAAVVELSASGGQLPPRDDEVLEAVRRAGVDRVDLLVVADSGVEDEVVEALSRRYQRPSVLLPPGSSHPVWAAVPTAGATVAVGDLELRIHAVAGRLAVDGRPTARSG